MSKSGEYPTMKPNIEEEFFEELRLGFYKGVLFIGVALLLASFPLLSNGDEFYKYLGRITNSIAFQVVGLVMVYGYIKWYSKLGTINQKRGYSYFLFTLSLLIVFSIGFQPDIESHPLSISLENLALEVIGFVLIYWFVDKFLDQLQNRQQRFVDNVIREQEAKLVALETALEMNRVEIKNMGIAVDVKDAQLKKVMSIENRIEGILADRQFHSFSSIESDLNRGKLLLSDHDKPNEIQAALGKLNADGKIEGEYRGYFWVDSNKQNPK